MSNDLFKSVNDLTVLFSARPVAIPLMLLLIYKIYNLAPATLGYVIALVMLTGLFAVRWVVFFIARERRAFAIQYLNTKSNKRKDGR